MMQDLGTRRVMVRWACVVVACVSACARAGVDDARSVGEGFAAARSLMNEKKFEEAEKLLRQVDSETRDGGMSAAARYNLGFCAFQRGKALAESEPEKALALFESAASAYRASLDVMPGDERAAQGLEISRRWIQRLRDLKKQNEKKDQQEGQKSDSKQNQDGKGDPSKGESGEDSKGGSGEPKKSDGQESKGKKEGKDREKQLRDLAEEQRKAAENSESSSGGGPAPSEEQMEQKQKELSEKTRAAKDGMSKGEEKSGAAKESSPSEALEKAGERQKEAERALREGDMKSAAEKQREAARAIREAADRVGSGSDRKDEERAGEGEEKKDEKQDGKQSRAGAAGKQQIDRPVREVDPLAKQLLDREQRQRAQRQRWLKGQMVRPTPVEKDW